MTHSHDGIDWDARLRQLREGDELAAPETRALVGRLLESGDRSVIDVGSGAGGAAAEFASVLGKVGGTLTVVDSAPELLSAALDRVEQVASPHLHVRSVLADAAEDDAMAGIEPADLVFVSMVAHHLPDQLAGLRRFADLTRQGGRLALVEFGLEQRVLPWDVGVGEPGLEDRLLAARAEWFRSMRADMQGAVRLPMGWSAALSEVGLRDVRSWHYLVDRQAPLSDLERRAVLRRLEWFRKVEEHVVEADRHALNELLDEEGPNFAGHRDDVYVTATYAVHVGSRN
ncbi:class I SAM-dependent methyltransferase [Parasphingorhabdus pacifica]